MRLPNKVTPYSKSVIAKFPEILTILREQDLTPNELLESIAGDRENMSEILDALDCLFALRKIELVQEGSRLHYVERDSV